MSFHGTTTTKNSDASLEGVPYMGFAFFTILASPYAGRQRTRL
jgi:hypothetical protein